MTEPINASVWRRASRNSALSQDRQRRIPRLSATGRSRRRLPGRDGLARETDRQAPALVQARVIRRAVGHFMLLLRNMMARQLALNGMGRSGSQQGLRPILTEASPPISDPGNNAARRDFGHPAYPTDADGKYGIKSDGVIRTSTYCAPVLPGEITSSNSRQFPEAFQ